MFAGYSVISHKAVGALEIKVIEARSISVSFSWAGKWFSYVLIIENIIPGAVKTAYQSQ